MKKYTLESILKKEQLLFIDFAKRVIVTRKSNGNVFMYYCEPGKIKYTHFSGLNMGSKASNKACVNNSRNSLIDFNNGQWDFMDEHGDIPCTDVAGNKIVVKIKNSK